MSAPSKWGNIVTADIECLTEKTVRCTPRNAEDVRMVRDNCTVTKSASLKAVHRLMLGYHEQDPMWNEVCTTAGGNIGGCTCTFSTSTANSTHIIAGATALANPAEICTTAALLV